ncbi:putative leucine-rich repeat-containing protein DDB_G0290503 [Argopecten irradians]|uniref:putative leucine-rich repeat-containing protein DDB_G0290503 n=1 Tax=Argopecten irradians TaxID=31199 RepID=UPI003711FE68
MNLDLPRFLFLQPPKESVKTQLGSLLLDETLSGQLYVKGLWVSDLTDQDLAAGVNFTTLQLDRDRNAIPKPSEIDHMVSLLDRDRNGVPKPSKIDHMVSLLDRDRNAVPKPSEIDHMVSLLDRDRNAVPKPSEIDHMVSLLDRDRNAVPKPSEIDHMVSLLDRVRNAVPKLSEIDHMVSLLDRDRNAVPKPSEIDHMVSLLDHDRNTVLIPSEIDHMVSLLDGDRNGVPKPSEIDHMVSFLDRDRNGVPKPSEIDHMVSLLDRDRNAVPKPSEIDHMVSLLDRDRNAVPKPSEIDHMVSLLDRDRNAVPKPSEIDHMVSLLDRDRNAVPKPSEIDHMVSLLDRDRNAVPKPSEIDHMVSLLDRDRNAVLIPSEIDHTVSLLDRDRNAVPKPSEIDHMVSLLDRDRNAVPKPSEIDHMMSGIWLQAIKKKPELINRYFNLLKSERYKDIRHAAEYMTDDLAKKIAFEFLNEFGKNAFPMLNSSSADQIASVSEELHLKTILCTQTMHEILIKSGCYRSLESALEENRVRQRTPVAFFSLTQTEIDTLESAVDLARLVDPSLDVSILDIIETNQSETCSSEDSRISVPRWYLDKETVHKRGALCRLSPGDCKCCEVMLCSALLYLSKQEMVNSPLMYLIQELVTKSHRRESQGTELPTEGSHPSLHNQGSHPSLHNQGSHLSAHNQGSHLSAHNQGSHPSLHNQVFIARESKLQEKIQQLEESLTNERQKVLKVMTKLKETEEQLTLREISVIDEETRIRESYKSEIEQWKKTSQVKFEDLLAKKDKLIMNLEATVSFKEKMLSRTQIQLEEAEAATEKKVGCLVDELTHYIAQNRNRTKSLSKLCAEQYQSTEEEESRGKWQLLQELCDTVLTELQEEKVLCSVCRWSRKNTMIQPCGHYCLCEKCAETLMSNQQDCPVCRSPIHRCLKVFET